VYCIVHIALTHGNESDVANGWTMDGRVVLTFLPIRHNSCVGSAWKSVRLDQWNRMGWDVTLEKNGPEPVGQSGECEVQTNDPRIESGIWARNNMRQLCVVLYCISVCVWHLPNPLSLFLTYLT